MKYFQDLKRPCKGTIGGKAGNLKRAFEAGFPIPPTVVLSVETANSLLGGKNAAIPPLFEQEAKQLFATVLPVMVRSSAAEEDGSGASFPGIFESVEARTMPQFFKAVSQVLASYSSPRAEAYRKLLGLPPSKSRAMAVMVQPLVKADYAGAATYCPSGTVSVDMSRSSNRGITSGKGAEVSASFDIRNKTFDHPVPAKALPAMRLAAAAAIKASRLFGGKATAIEFAVTGNGLTLLQARPAPTEDSPRDMDMAGLYRRVADAMTDFSLKPGDWSLAETLDFAAFNYLGTARKVNETLEHLRIKLCPRAWDAATAKGWLRVRNAAVQTIFPPASDKRAAAAATALAKDGILLVFEPSPNAGSPVKTLSFGTGKTAFKFSFSIPPEALDMAEKEYLLNRLSGENMAAHLSRFEYERRTAKAIAAAIREQGLAENAYETVFLRVLDKMARLADRRLALVRKATPQSAGTQIVGLPVVKADKAITGRALTPAHILAARGKGYIYAANDLEPSFISHTGKLAGVVVSRGSRNSHAAAICAELKLPLVCAAKGISVVQDGELLSVDFGSGRITRLSRQ